MECPSPPWHNPPTLATPVTHPCSGEFNDAHHEIGSGEKPRGVAALALEETTQAAPHKIAIVSILAFILRGGIGTVAAVQSPLSESGGGSRRKSPAGYAD